MNNRFVTLLFAFVYIFAVTISISVDATDNCDTYTFAKLGLKFEIPSDYVTLTLNPNAENIEKAESNGIKTELAVSDMRKNNVYLMSLDYSTISRYILCAERLGTSDIDAAEMFIAEKLRESGREYLSLGKVDIGGKMFIKYSALIGGKVVNTSYSAVHGRNLISLTRLGDDSEGLYAFVAGCRFSECKSYSDTEEKMCVILGTHSVNIPLDWTKSERDGKTEYLDFESRDRITISAVKCDAPVLCGCETEPKLCSKNCGEADDSESLVYALYGGGVQYFISYTSQSREEAESLAEMSLSSFIEETIAQPQEQESGSLLRTKNGAVKVTYRAALGFLALCTSAAIIAVAAALKFRLRTVKRRK